MALTDEEREALKARLEAKLQPERMRATLAFAGLYQLTHELIKEAVVPKVRFFYWRGFNETGIVYDEKRYAEEVLSRAPKNKFRASLLWLADRGAITRVQADRLNQIYGHRHDLTHQLGKYLVDPDHEPDVNLFVDALHILREIHRFWTWWEIVGGRFEEHGDVNVDDVTPGVLLLLQMAIDAYIEGLPFGKEALKRHRASMITPGE